MPRFPVPLITRLDISSGAEACEDAAHTGETKAPTCDEPENSTDKEGRGKGIADAELKPTQIPRPTGSPIKAPVHGHQRKFISRLSQTAAHNLCLTEQEPSAPDYVLSALPKERQEEQSKHGAMASSPERDRPAIDDQTDPGREPEPPATPPGAALALWREGRLDPATPLTALRSSSSCPIAAQTPQLSPDKTGSGLPDLALAEDSALSASSLITPLPPRLGKLPFEVSPGKPLVRSSMYAHLRHDSPQRTSALPGCSSGADGRPVVIAELHMPVHTAVTDKPSSTSPTKPPKAGEISDLQRSHNRPTRLCGDEEKHIKEKLQEPDVTSTTASSHVLPAEPAAIEEAQARLECPSTGAAPSLEHTESSRTVTRHSDTPQIVSSMDSPRQLAVPVGSETGVRGSMSQRPSGDTLDHDSILTYDSLRQQRLTLIAMRERASALGVALPPSEMKGPGHGVHRISAGDDLDPDVRHEDFSIKRRSKDQTAVAKPPQEISPIPSDKAVLKVSGPPSPLKGGASSEAHRSPSTRRSHKSQEGRNQPSGQVPPVSLLDMERNRSAIGMGYGILGSHSISSLPRQERDELFRKQAIMELEAKGEEIPKPRQPHKSSAKRFPGGPREDPKPESQDRPTEGLATSVRETTVAGRSKLSKAWNSLKRGTGKLLPRKSLANLREAPKKEETVLPGSQFKSPEEMGPVATTSTQPVPPSNPDRMGLIQDTPKAVMTWLNAREVEDKSTSNLPTPIAHTTRQNNSMPKTGQDEKGAPQVRPSPALLPTALGPPASPPPTSPLPPTPPRPSDESQLSLDSPSEKARMRREQKREKGNPDGSDAHGAVLN